MFLIKDLSTKRSKRKDLSTNKTLMEWFKWILKAFIQIFLARRTFERLYEEFNSASMTEAASHPAVTGEALSAWPTGKQQGKHGMFSGFWHPTVNGQSPENGCSNFSIYGCRIPIDGNTWSKEWNSFSPISSLIEPLAAKLLQHVPCLQTLLSSTVSSNTYCQWVRPPQDMIWKPCFRHCGAAAAAEGRIRPPFATKTEENRQNHTSTIVYYIVFCVHINGRHGPSNRLMESWYPISLYWLSQSSTLGL